MDKLDKIHTGFSRTINSAKLDSELHRNDKQGLIARQILRRASVLDDTGTVKKQCLRQFDKIQKL